jgi:drug/metabolite transporter (DMT)-like permease
LSAFSFITPLFGVIGGYFIMHDTLTAAFAVAAVLVIAGLYLVKRPSPPVIDPLLNATKT